MKVNHFHQAKAFVDSCKHYNPQFVGLASSTICYYVTYHTQRFTSVKNMRNYISSNRFIHWQLGLTEEALDSFPVT